MLVEYKTFTLGQMFVFIYFGKYISLQSGCQKEKECTRKPWQKTLISVDVIR